MQHEKWRNVTIFGSSYIPSPPWINVGSCDYDRIYASVSTSCFNIDSGGRGVVTNSSPSCEVKIQWCDHFSLRSSLWNGSKNFFISWVIVLKIPRFGRVSLWALPDSRAIHTYIQGFLKESLTKLVSIGSRLYQRILQFCKYCATRDDLLHIMVSKPFRSAQK